MFGKKSALGLEPPPLATAPGAKEILRLWVTPEWQQMQVAVATGHPDPSVWGIALVDVARHVAKAYAMNFDIPEAESLDRIRQVFDAEWSSPTQVPEGRLRD